MRRSGNIGNKTIPCVFWGLLLLLWQLISDAGVIEKFILPSPSDIVITLFAILPELARHIFVTLQEGVMGLAVAVVFSVIMAVLMDNVTLVKKAANPLVVVSQTVPVIILAPLFALWFGFGQLPKIVIVVLICFFPILQNLLAGFDSVDPQTLNLFKSMGAGRIKTFFHLKLPASLENFFSGLRIAGTYSIMGAVIGEWLGGNEGLGVYMMVVRRSFALDKVFAVTIVIIALSLILLKLISLLQKLCMPWQRLFKHKF